MYIWVAVNVDDQVSELRKRAERYAKEQGLSSPTFTLPFHISLKISFQIPDEWFDEAVNDIRNFYKTLNPFEVMVRGIEQAGSIVWITMHECSELNDIHKQLDKMLFDKYGVLQHMYDKDFIFHTSIFMLNDTEKITKVFEEVKDAYVPERLKVAKFIIGVSEVGNVGTYQVIEEVQI